MQNFNFKSVCKVLIALVCFVSLSVAWGEGETKRGFFDSFTNFFTPTGSIKGEGPVFDELKGVETQIDKIEVQYSRERRPGNKTRYRKQLDSLRNVRDSLIVVIGKLSSGSVAVNSSASVSSSAAKQAVSQSVSTTAVAMSSVANAVPASSSANVACVHDTVFVHDTLVVRDTVVIHDTLYVVLANKPETPAPKEKKKATTAPAK
jgi:hypothetical protein